MIGLGLAWIGRRLGLAVDSKGILIGSLLPDADFLFLVPFIGRQRGHRTVTHSPAFHLATGYLFRRYGFWSVFVGAMMHSAIDDFETGKPPGISWFWPISNSRVRLLGKALSRR